ncbi:excinuclease ABC subunit C [Candidatus Woesearchaeota archaeon]|jgi:excinuclease ABC subunit C|nr:excinuclease ABC subunit C [Candidatus Woesearchaeota archaeon]MBT6519869.1 excinuclease ABC subunit C [Candidatus Woesearchaeota archaeon]MBT7367161.1 excinuclease ABC subunit C [Candidatus Woesearchaeota archaeon]
MINSSILANLPKNPGCYLFKDNSKKIIYIGKAKNIKKRVSSYFQKKHDDKKTLVLVTKIAHIDFVITDSEVEALLLENNLIKKHKPKYNIDLKDSKRYAFIQITDEEFPRILLARTRSPNKSADNSINKNSLFFGPFISGSTRDNLIQLLRKVFKIRTCRRMPKKACLRYHINLCDAPCIGNISKLEYNKKIKNAVLVLKQKNTDLIKKLEKEMTAFSKKLDFEHAMELKAQINSINWLSERQKMERNKNYDEDILNYIVDDNTQKVYLILFNIYKGTLINKQEFEFDFYDGCIEDFILRYYSDNAAQIPKELILPIKLSKPSGEFLKLKLCKQENKKLESKNAPNFIVTVPKIGEKKQLLELVTKNIELSFFAADKKLKDLQNKLKLNDSPNIIECFDVSHISGTSTVASMVQFRNAKPFKQNYRRFKIRSVDGADDFKSIAEVVRRRYSRLKSENEEFPNLILIDGGKGQLSAALAELKALNVKIPIISIAKKFEEVYIPGSKFPLKIERKSEALKLLQNLRDEAHRFAIAYNRLLRRKKLNISK